LKLTQVMMNGMIDERSIITKLIDEESPLNG